MATFIKNAAAGIGGIVLSLSLALVATSSAAASDARSKRKAREMVANLQQNQAAVLSKFPALKAVDDTIRTDCSVKNAGNTEISEFCGCASAVTMSLWFSGADPKMIARLEAYLKNPTDTEAQGFVAYQGPELYAPICKLASER